MDVDAAWREIEHVYRAGLPRFERVARAVTDDRELALEAVQDGFADALRHADRYTAAGPLEAWVWRCVVNRARKARRRGPAPAAPASPNGDGGSDRELVRARVAALPERQRLAVFLRYYADLDYRQIASILGVEVGTVSATLSAAHAALRDQLEEVVP